jgi:hypothetical protein
MSGLGTRERHLSGWRRKLNINSVRQAGTWCNVQREIGWRDMFDFQGQ